MKRLILGLAVLVVLLAGVAPIHAGTTYIVTDLGDLPGGDDSSSARRINEAGQVAGLSHTAGGSRGFLYSDGVMTDIGVLPGHNISRVGDINDAGQIVGRSEEESVSLSMRPVLYSGGVMTALGSFGGGYGFAYGINNSIEVVGLSRHPNGVTHAFLHSGGSMTDIGSFDGGYSCAYDINNNHQVVGVSTLGSADRGFIWQAGEVMTDLGDLPGGAQTTRAYAINEAG